MLRRRRTGTPPGLSRRVCTIFGARRRLQPVAEAAPLRRGSRARPCRSRAPARRGRPATVVERRVRTSAVWSFGRSTRTFVCWTSAGPCTEERLGSPHAPGLEVREPDRDAGEHVHDPAVGDVRADRRVRRERGAGERRHGGVDPRVGRVAEHRARLRRARRTRGRPATGSPPSGRPATPRATSLPGDRERAGERREDTFSPSGTAPGCQVTVARPSSVWTLPACRGCTSWAPDRDRRAAARPRRRGRGGGRRRGAARAGGGHDERERGADVVGRERVLAQVGAGDRRRSSRRRRRSAAS